MSQGARDIVFSAGFSEEELRCLATESTAAQQHSGFLRAQCFSPQEPVRTAPLRREATEPCSMQMAAACTNRH